MTSDESAGMRLEIGHVLFIDIVGYSKRLINEQSELLQLLNAMVRRSEQVRAADAEGKLLRLTTGDGMALVFRNSPEAPVNCALELSRADLEHPELELRMGIPTAKPPSRVGTRPCWRAIFRKRNASSPPRRLRR